MAPRFLLYCILCAGLLTFSDSLYADSPNKSERHAFRIEPFVEGLGIPWGMAFRRTGVFSSVSAKAAYASLTAMEPCPTHWPTSRPFGQRDRAACST